MVSGHREPAFNLSIPFFHISGREFMAALIFTIGYSYKKRNLQVHHSWWCVLVGLLLVTIIYVENLPIERLAEFPVINDYTSQGWFILYFVVGMAIPLLFTKMKYLK